MHSALYLGNPQYRSAVDSGASKAISAFSKIKTQKMSNDDLFKGAGVMFNKKTGSFEFQ